MKELFQSGLVRLFLVCASALLCELIGGYAKKNACFKALKTVCSLCVCVTVFSFFGKGARGGLSETLDVLDTVEETVLTGVSSVSAEASEEALLEKTRTLLENELKEEIFEEYGINPTRLCISFSVERKNESTTAEVSSVEVRFDPNTDVWARQNAEAFLYDCFGELVHTEE